ncbi:MAG: hypothetical protein AAGA60_03195 [Cyanobacteria bacterium P01_E01_bin.42]
MLLKLFRSRYPQGSLSSELLQFEQGKYVVRVTIHAEGASLGTGLGAAETIEEAEDRARNRALALLNFEETPSLPESLPESLSEARSLNGYPPHLSSPTPAAALPFSREEETMSPERLAHQDELALPDVPPPSLTPVSSVLPPTDIAASGDAEVPETVAPDFDFPPPPSEPLPPDPVMESPSPSLTPPPESPPEVAAIPLEEPSASPMKVAGESIDFSDILAQTNIEIKRLQWTQSQGREFLVERYGKRSRQVLTDDELLDFLEYLKSQ